MTEPADGVARSLTAAAVYTMYRSAEVHRSSLDLSDRPVIIVANHSAGFPDPVLIMHGMNRRPRFLATATLWGNAAVGKVFDFAGVIPVTRAKDGGTQGNVGAFEACYRALRNLEVIAIFPEGHIHSGAQIDDVHTGAARIALGARASGVAGIAIVPVGLYYESKPGRRGRVYTKVGDPINLDDGIESYADPGDDQSDVNQDAVGRLTEDIARRLRGVAPDYSSEDEWRVLAASAEVALRSRHYDPSIPVSFAAREDLARSLQDASPREVANVLDAAELYRAALVTHRIRDVNVASHVQVGGALPDHTVRSLGAAVALAPTAAVGFAANVAPMVAMRLISNNLRTGQLMKSTIQTLASPVMYAAAWTAWGAVLRSKGMRFGGTTAWLCGAIGGWALVLMAERSDVVRDGLSGWIRLGVDGPDAEVVSARQALINAVDTASG